MDILTLIALLGVGFLLLAAWMSFQKRREAARQKASSYNLMGLELPATGVPGTATSHQIHALHNYHLLEDDGEWLSKEQAGMVLGWARFAEAVWRQKCGQTGPLPAEAIKSTLATFMSHESYQLNVAMMAEAHAQGREGLPDDGCTRHLSQILTPYAENASEYRIA